MSSVHATCTPINWPTDSQKYDIYINEESMQELVFGSQQPKAKDFRRHCCNVMLLHIRQKLTNKLDEDHQQAIIEIQGQHWQRATQLHLAITDPDNQIRAIQYENVALQEQRDFYQTQLQKSEDIIIYLRARYVDHVRDSDKDNIIITVSKHTTSANDKYHDLPYYVSRIQRRKRYARLRQLSQPFPDHEVIAEIDSPSNIHAFNRFEEEGYVV